MSRFKEVKEYVGIMSALENELKEINKNEDAKKAPILIVKRVMKKLTFVLVNSGYEDEATERITAIVIKEGKNLSFNTVSYFYYLEDSSYSEICKRVSLDKMSILNKTTNENYSNMEYIQRLFETANYKEYLKKYENCSELIQMNKISAAEIPATLIKHIRAKGIFKNGTLKYEKEREKVSYAICSVCGKDVSDKVQSYSLYREHKVICPECSNTLVAYPSGKPLHYNAENNTLLFQKIKGVVYIRSFHIVSKRGEYEIKQVDQISVSADGTITQYVLDKEFTIDNNKPLFAPSKFEWNRNSYSIFKDINNVYGLTQGVLSNTALKYMSIEELEFHSLQGGIVDYIQMFYKYPIVEMYEKAGAIFLLRDWISRNTLRTSYSSSRYTYPFWDDVERSKNFYFQPKFIKIIAKYNLNTYMTDLFKEKYEATLYKNKKDELVYPTMNIEEFFLTTRYTDVSVIKALSKLIGSEWGKVCQYMSVQNDVSLVEYKDYMGMRTKIHDFNASKREFKLSKWSRYPKDLNKSHKDITSEHDICTTYLDEETYAEIYSEIKEYEYAPEDGEYVMKIPSSAKEIAEEGRDLSHCVKTYIPEILKRETMVAFVRAKNDIETPLYTVEYKDERIIQIRGYDNTDCPSEVNRFVQEWAQYCSEVFRKEKVS